MAIESIQNSTAAAVSAFDNQNTRLRTPREEEPARPPSVKQDEVQLSQKARELAASESNDSSGSESGDSANTTDQPATKAIAAYKAATES